MGELADQPEEAFTSELSPNLTTLPHTHHLALHRQRHEHGVFQALLQMVPGLEERLMEGSEDDIVAIAEKVSSKLYFLHFADCFQSYRREPRVLDRMTQKGSKGRSSTGSYLWDKPSALLFPVMSKRIVGFTMNVLEPFYALQGWTGRILSMPNTFSL
jgi:hypothetical protein